MSNILVTGANGFLGRNLVENLKNIRDGKNRTRPNIQIDEIYQYDINSTQEDLETYCAKADYVFHLAGVNRPKEESEFREGNVDLTKLLLDTLKACKSKATVMLSSSVQATLAGRFGASEYGLSKRIGEELMFQYREETGNTVWVYRFPNLAGKWIRPNYNSAVATFCYNVARELPINVADPTIQLELLFVEDLVDGLLDAMEGIVHRCEYPERGSVIDKRYYDGIMKRPSDDGKFCYIPCTYKVTLGRIRELLYKFHDQPENLIISADEANSLERKLHSMYISYLPEDKVVQEMDMKEDDRGSFTELFHLQARGQVSVNVSKPGITKGEHWHNSKWEIFIVVSGHGLIRERKLGTDPATGKPYPVLEYAVSGDKIQAVYMLPGYTHSIINLSDTENLVTVMWANEEFDPKHPDTFYEKLDKQ